jgi:hypothetical protein
MTSPFKRAVFSCSVAAFFACAVPASPADSDLTAVTNALSTKLVSDDTWANNAGKVVERQLLVIYSTRASGACEVTIHRDATSTYPYLGQAVVSPTKAVTYYMVPLDKMSDKLAVANVKSGQQAATAIAGSSHSSVFTYSDDTTVPLAGLKSDVEPNAVSSQGPVPKYPTFADAASANNAIAALAKAAASCAAPGSS